MDALRLAYAAGPPGMMPGHPLLAQVCTRAFIRRWQLAQGEARSSGWSPRPVWFWLAVLNKSTGARPLRLGAVVVDHEPR